MEDIGLVLGIIDVYNLMQSSNTTEEVPSRPQPPDQSDLPSPPEGGSGPSGSRR